MKGLVIRLGRCQERLYSAAPQLVRDPNSEKAMDAAARTALSVVYDHGRDDEVRELRRLLVQRNEQIADMRARMEVLDQLAATNYRERMEARWESLCEAGIRMGGFDTRHLVENHFERSRWGIAAGVYDVHGVLMTPGPFNFAPNERAEFLLPESTLIRLIADDFHARRWRPLLGYLELLSQSGIFQPREGGYFQQYHVTHLPRLYEDYFDTDDEDLSDGMSDEEL